VTGVLARPTHGLGSFSGWQKVALLPVLAVEFALAFAAAMQPRLAFTCILGGVVLIVALIKPVPVLVLAFPASFAYWRVGPAAVDMSITDAFTVLATIAALPHVPWADRRLRMVLLLFGFYLAAVAVSVVASPSTSALIELGHRAHLVAGPLMIGSALAALGKARLGLRVFVLAATVVAVAAILDAATSGFAAAYPFGMHKNGAGAHFVSALLVLLAASPLLAFRRSTTSAIAILLFVGLLATQSRGAILGLVFASAFFFLRSRNRRVARLAPIVLLVTVVALAFAISSFNREQDVEVGQSFTSYNTRIDNYAFAIENGWKPHVQFGSGPRWFRGFGFNSAPHNLVVSELSETGLMGLGAMTIFLGGTLMILWKRHSQLSDVALLVLVERLIDSMLGILWVAGTGTVPWLMVGLALGEREDGNGNSNGETATDLELVQPLGSIDGR
jgi:hypothetical protein